MPLAPIVIGQLHPANFMSIPNDDIIKKVMSFLVERYKLGPNPIVLVADLTRACALNAAEYQSIFQLLFQVGVFRPIGQHQLQIDQLVRDYAPRLPHCSLNDVMQFFRGHRSRNQLLRMLVGTSTLYTHKPDASANQLQIVCPNAEAELIAHYAKNPAELYSLPPRKFEELVAAIFRNNHFEVELTPATRDGGVDIIAVERSALTGKSVHLIECKRYAPENKVGIGIVQRLAGVVNQSAATKGIIVTTSTFTRDAQAAAQKSEYILTLNDYDVLVLWLKRLTGGEA